MTKLWTVRLLGCLRAEGPLGVVERFRTHRTASMLGYLAYHLGRPISREALAELLWPEDDPDDARRKVTVALSWLRGVLEPTDAEARQVLISDRGSIRLNPATVTTDIDQFQECLSAARTASQRQERDARLETALSHYGGSLLPAHYEDWITPAQLHLESRYFEVVRTLVESREEEGALGDALDIASTAIPHDPLREELHRMVLRLYRRMDQHEAALRHFRSLEALLERELGSPPDAETRALVEDVLESPPRSAGSRIVTPSPTSPPDPPGQNGSGADNPREKVADCEMMGEPVPLNSPFYLQRRVDHELHLAVRDRVSIMQVVGTRQVGKSSLLVRAIQWAKELGSLTMWSNLRLVHQKDLVDVDRFMLAVAKDLSDQLGERERLVTSWDPEDGANLNFRRFMRAVLVARPDATLLWGLDGIDPVLHLPFGPEFFALIRSWHNERAMDPVGPWSRLSVVMCYSIEAHLLIPDPEQSPFNIGTRLVVEDFASDQVRDLNRRYREPLRTPDELATLHGLLGGHPFLTRTALREMSQGRLDLEDLLRHAERSDDIFGPHLRRLGRLVCSQPTLLAATCAVLEGSRLEDDRHFHALRSAGVLSGSHWREARLRNGLYARYLRQELLEAGRDIHLATAVAPTG